MKNDRRNLFRTYYRTDLKKLVTDISEKNKFIWIDKEQQLNRLNYSKYDYIALVNLIGDVPDVQSVFEKVRQNCTQNTRIIITYYNYLWEPILKLAELVGLKKPQSALNWLSLEDIENLLKLTDFETVLKGQRLLFPLPIPFITTILNRYFSRLPFINRLCLTNYIVARPVNLIRKTDYSVSIVIPARNEAGNIVPLMKRLPIFAVNQEIILVEDHSKDNTWKIIQKVQKNNTIHKLKTYKLISGIGKANAVSYGISKSRGDIIMILDSDLSVPPEDLPKFYQALLKNHGEFINGTRLVYPLEKDSMRFLNIIANKLFSIVFSWTLNQRFTDTLCGTKAFFKKDYNRIKKLKKYFGNLDPFGDFDLIFGAVKLNLKVTEIPVRYYARTYGKSNIRRFLHGWLLFKMWLYALKKFKFA